MLAHRHGNEVYQTSTMGALLAGVYEGNVTVGELLHHGDFGLGTFNALDGEMLVLDGACYQLRNDAAPQSPILANCPRSPFSPGFTPTTPSTCPRRATRRRSKP
jgi:alpha-acetolactate decarboxylase